MLCVLFANGMAFAQMEPSAPNRPWDNATAASQFKIPPRTAPAVTMDPAKIYNLAELINIAEQNNPDTRVAWQNARARAADVGIAESTLYPTLAAAVLAETSRFGVLFGPYFVRQTIDSWAPTFLVDYNIFDLQRSQEIAITRFNLLAANFQFNDTHRRIIFQVMDAYYRLLDSKGQQEAADANLRNAQTVRQAAEARLENGLATKPDVLEARSAEARADYDLQAAIGNTEIAHGDVATAIGISPTTPFRVESIHDIKLPEAISETVEGSIDKALAQRPDLLERVSQLRATNAEVSSAKRAYAPKLGFKGSAGMAAAYGQQYPTPNYGVYSGTFNPWDAELNLTWTLFDGLNREKRLARAEADRKQAEASLQAARDQIENQVWAAYSTARTALREQRAAAALLESATESYNAALESYNYGVRSQIDVVSAQKALADARTADVTARTQLLTGLAALSFQTGDLLYGKVP